MLFFAHKKKRTKRKIDIISQSMQTITVSVENVKTETYPIEVVYVGEAAEGFVSGPYSLSFSQVGVTAPESVHKKIKKEKLKLPILTIY